MTGRASPSRSSSKLWADSPESIEPVWQRIPLHGQLRDLLQQPVLALDSVVASALPLERPLDILQELPPPLLSKLRVNPRS